MQNNRSPLLRPYHVAKRLDRSVRTVRWYAKCGRLSAIRIGKLWFFDPEVVEAFRLRLENGEEA